MEYRTLGASGVKVSVLSFGGWQVGDQDYWGAGDGHDAAAAVNAAIDAGITLFDTAEFYGSGNSERVLANCLGRRRGEILLASKIWPTHCVPGEVRTACEASLRRLQADVVDLYQVHWPFREHAFERIWEELDQLRTQGKIRWIGVSNFGRNDLEAWMNAGGAISNQLPYNLATRMIEPEILPACVEAGVGVLAYMPLLQGVLAGKWAAIDDIPQMRRRTRHYRGDRPGTRHGEPGCEDEMLALLAALRREAAALGVAMADLALAWILKNPAISSVIVGARNPDQLQRNVRGMELELPNEVYERLCAASASVAARLAGNADLWFGAAESRYR